MAKQKEKTNGEIQTAALPDTFGGLESRILDLLSAGHIDLPKNYSAENALKAAWIALQEVQDKDKKPALSVCTRPSIYQALLDTIVQGLNPAKDQCYYVVYGNKLVCMRSYFGTESVLKRIYPDAEILPQAVYEGDEFAYEIRAGRKVVTKHVQDLENVKPDKIRAAYAVVELGNGAAPHTEIMTIEQIKNAWSMGKAYHPDKKDGAHQMFSDRMACKVVITRACLQLINSSDDSALVRAARRSTVEAVEAEVERDMLEEGEGEELAFEAEAEIEEAPAAESRKSSSPNASEIPF